MGEFTLAARLTVTQQSSASLLGWTFLIVAALGFSIIFKKHFGGDSLGRWGRYGTAAPISLATIVVFMSILAAVSCLFIYHGRTGNVPGRWLHASLGIAFAAVVLCPVIDHFRHPDE